MNWRNVNLIFHRELRDQLRDRRTLFTIAVLPLLMYPLLGMAFLQMANFSKEHPSRVVVLGVGNLPDDNPLFVADRESGKLRPVPDEKLIQLETRTLDRKWRTALELEQIRSEAAGEAIVAVDPGHPLHDIPPDMLEDFSLRRILADERIDCVVVVPPDFNQQLAGQQPTGVQIYAQGSDDKSRMAASRLETVFTEYRDQLASQNLQRKSISTVEIRPFTVDTVDLSSEVSKRAAVWSRVLPFVVFIWALTGAFYPAIDLCAGEKERGTLETLLSSPASRNEIVWGKLFTVIMFSMGTSLLNLFSMSFTGLFVINSMARMNAGAMTIGPPPFFAFGWLIVALIPLAALFSATSLAVASFARSSKEGQYYLMPILLISLPLMMLPMMPGAELDLGTSLIPISGLMLVLRALIENHFTEAMQFAAPVLAVTGCCCLLVIRWAVNQFNNEKVLFRESERFGLGVLFKHLVRERRAMPTFMEAIFCGVLLLVIRFFTTLVAQPPVSFEDFARQTLLLHVGMIIGPVVLMAIVLTTRPLATLGFSRTRLATIPLAMLMAIGLHPIIAGFGELVLRVYPMPADGGQLQQLMEQIFAGAPGFISIILLFAVLPAFSEEIAFRGFIMNGLRQAGDRWTAVLVASLFFGATHGMLQQSMIAFFTGTIIGFVSYQAGSIWPAICYHLTHNTITVTLSQTTLAEMRDHAWTRLVFQAGDSGQISYTLPAYFVLSAIGIGIFVWFYRMNFGKPDAPRQATRNLLLSAEPGSAG